MLQGKLLSTLWKEPYQALAPRKRGLSYGVVRRRGLSAPFPPLSPGVLLL